MKFDLEDTDGDLSLICLPRPTVGNLRPFGDGSGQILREASIGEWLGR